MDQPGWLLPTRVSCDQVGYCLRRAGHPWAGRNLRAGGAVTRRRPGPSRGGVWSQRGSRRASSCRDQAVRESGSGSPMTLSPICSRGCPSSQQPSPVNVMAMRLADRARVAVIGAGPGGLTAAKHAISAGFDTTVFEASDDLGGQWNTTAAHSGVWPGMRTNTSRAMTAFSVCAHLDSSRHATTRTQWHWADLCCDEPARHGPGRSAPDGGGTPF